MNLSPDSDAALPPEDLALLRNHSFDELGVGDSASLERTLSTQDLRLFAALSGAAVADGAGAGAGAGGGVPAGPTQDFTVLGAGSMPKNSFVQPTVPEKLFVTSLPVLPY